VVGFEGGTAEGGDEQQSGEDERGGGRRVVLGARCPQAGRRGGADAGARDARGWGAGEQAAGDGLAAELAEYCRARLATAKVPVRWLVTGSFPMTASGKIRKDVLRDQLSEASAERPPGS